MSDIENRPPTSVLSSKSGLKDGITKPKDKSIKPKVRYWHAKKYASFCCLNVMWLKKLVVSRRSWAVLREKSCKPCSLRAKTRLCWWESLYDLTMKHMVIHMCIMMYVTKHMMIDTNLTHGASPCLHGWEHMSARRCHLTSQSTSLLLPIIANYCQLSPLDQSTRLLLLISCHPISWPVLLSKFVFWAQSIE